eukprot:scaffold37522_cov228-Skeletonema_dohrnii-CCMP3373.AAC.1
MAENTVHPHRGSIAIWSKCKYHDADIQSWHRAVEVGTHVVCNGNYEGTNIFEVAVVVIGFFKELEFDHVAIVAVGVERDDRENGVGWRVNDGASC